MLILIKVFYVLMLVSWVAFFVFWLTFTFIKDEKKHELLLDLTVASFVLVVSFIVLILLSAYVIM